MFPVGYISKEEKEYQSHALSNIGGQASKSAAGAGKFCCFRLRHSRPVCIIITEVYVI